MGLQKSLPATSQTSHQCTCFYIPAINTDQPTPMPMPVVVVVVVVECVQVNVRHARGVVQR